MTYAAQLHHRRTQTARLELLACASDAAPHDHAAARRFAEACMRVRDVERAPGAWRRFAGLMIDAFRAGGPVRDQALTRPPSAAQTFRAPGWRLISRAI